MRLVPRSLSIVAAAALLGTAAAGSDPFAYDGFNYGPGPNLQLANGGFGWSGAWFSLNILPTGVADQGLDWPGLQTSGHSAFTAGYPSSDFTQYSRGLSAYGALEAIYISVLVRPNIGYGDVGGLAFGTWTNGMVMGARPTGVYGLMTPPGTLTSDSGVPVVQGQVTLLVARVTKNAGATVTWSLFVNPAIGAPMPAQEAATLTVPGTALPQAVMIYNDGGFSTDEIRVGASWDAVLPGAAVPGDLDGDGSVNFADLLVLLAAWGACEPPCPPVCQADIDGDCQVDMSDLLLLLAFWG
ncbi:MAG: hypothetical protein KF817_09090 [Phycisphaeraceae bacterium]|nr:hypothetical protein [Phycisphaeraceae bacterium]